MTPIAWLSSQWSCLTLSHSHLPLWCQASAHCLYCSSLSAATYCCGCSFEKQRAAKKDYLSVIQKLASITCTLISSFPVIRYHSYVVVSQSSSMDWFFPSIRILVYACCMYFYKDGSVRIIDCY